MDFIIPSNIMEEKLCNSCNKYLTVSPVKIYPGGIIKCGRCTRYDDGGTISLYNYIIERSIVRCINRFDGCKELLMSSQVIQHEQKCNHRIFSCPICINPERMSTFLFLHHLYRKHKESILKYPIFKIESLNEIQNYWFYKLEDNLFLISVKNAGRYSRFIRLKFNVLYVGKSIADREFQCQIFVSSDIDSVEIDIPCLSFPADAEFGTNVTVNITEAKVCNIKVVFGIEHSVKNIFRMPTSGVRPNDIFETPLALSRKFEANNLYFQKRNIFLKQELYNNSSLKPTIYKETGLILTMNNMRINLNLNCLNCSSLMTNSFTFGRDSLFHNQAVCFAKMPNGWYNLLCYECSLNEKLLDKCPTKIFIARDDFFNISFYCIWKCGNRFPCNSLYAHELYCKNHQQLQLCPINGCYIYFKLHSYVGHFRHCHPSILLPNPNTVFLVSLDVTKSPMNMICLVSNVCINVEFVWNEPYWRITLNQKLKSVKPRAFLYSEDRKFLLVVKERGEILELDKIYIKCYLINSTNMFDI